MEKNSAGKRSDEELERFELSELLDCYGELLTERQYSMLCLSINEDFSLYEIAEREGISKPGVHDVLRRAKERLHEFENVLGLCAKQRKVDECIDELNAFSNTLTEEKQAELLKIIAKLDT